MAQMMWTYAKVGLFGYDSDCTLFRGQISPKPQLSGRE